MVYYEWYIFLLMFKLVLDIVLFEIYKSILNWFFYMIVFKFKFNKVKRCYVFIFSDLEYKIKIIKVEN